jgi:membrane-associated protease RseP (regulator of RpoE activity)
LCAPPTISDSFPLEAIRSLRTFIRDYGLPVLLFGVTVVTTTANGARFMQNFLERLPPIVRYDDVWPWHWLAVHPRLFLTGLAFSLTLLGILLTHEFGHYFACRAHSIRSTLPWVLPAPTLSGTAGAVIQIRSNIPTRDALMDVGIYGPLAGYAASILAIVVGFLLSVGTPFLRRGLRFGDEPLTIRLVHRILLFWNPRLPEFHHLAPHPILIAGWIGLFITSLNLLPGGQLDGGHILYAISPRIHRICTWSLPAALMIAGAFFWAGWLLWGAILLIPAMRHPRVSSEIPLSRSRMLLGCMGIALLLLTFTPTPFYDSSLIAVLRR